ncbi:Na+/H+ antiporter subunit E [Mogibacterium pumilum]|uniref:Na+/H+ antiporter subunit E n=1 Tax=Mogibacterium pumilum TaxID=86332 RepID=UPI001A9A50A5|nr:Na+/H+ antiporter subunit E [Mogibacterium pumilum]
MNFLEVFGLLLFLWIVMSGIFTVKFILYGCISSFLISCFVVGSLRIGGLKSNRTYFILHANYPKLIIYFMWLIKEVVKSAADVSKIVLSHNMGLEPHVVWFKADYDNPAARAILANSITLTPGTVTIDIYDSGVFSVHALNRDFSEGLLTGKMQNRIAKLYGETIDYKVIDVVTDYDYREKEVVELTSKRFKRRRKNRDA